jgi:guanylate kinase
VCEDPAVPGLKKQPLLIVISGPSGVGKDSVLERMKERQLPFHFVVTATSRAPRPHETNGVDYFFYSKEEFERMIANDEFFEHTLVYEDYKGIPKAQVKKAFASGKDVVMRVDVQGAATVKSKAQEAILIFISPSSEEELIERLKQRKTDSEEQLKIRIQMARQEYRRIDEFDYQVVNCEGKLDEAVDIIRAIIRAEHHRVHPRKVNL